MAKRIMVTCPRCGQEFSTSPYKPSVHCSRFCQWGSPEDRFERFTDRSPGHGPSGDCWIWTGTIDRDGYGQFSINNKSVKVHSYSYRKHKGEVPRGMCVCHSCDMRKCVNPDHLWVGSPGQNAEDRDKKGRNKSSRGQEHANAKLTDADVVKIRADTRMQTIIAAEYGVDKTRISQIKAGKTWRHLLP